MSEIKQQPTATVIADIGTKRLKQLREQSRAVGQQDRSGAQNEK